MSLSPALIGLLGVLVGGCITAGSNYILTVRKERADLARDAAKRSEDLKVAARVVARELHIASIHIAKVSQQRLWRSFNIDDASFSLYQEVIARELPLDEWLKIQLSTFSLQQYKDILYSEDRDRSVSEKVASSLRDISEDLGSAAKILEKYTGEHANASSRGQS